MEQFIQALEALATAVVVAAVPILWRVGTVFVQAKTQEAALLVQQRLGDAAARVAGEIAAEIKASPNVQAASKAMVQSGALLLEERFRDTVKKRGIPLDTLGGMVAGELGKLGVPIR